MQVLESRFDLNERRVWFGKAKLLADRIVLKGLGYHRRIYLKDIVEVRWAGSELVIVLEGGEEVDMHVRAAALWKYELQARCGLKDAHSGGTRAGILPPEAEDSARDTGTTDLHTPSGYQPVETFLESTSSYRIRDTFAADQGASSVTEGPSSDTQDPSEQL
jgi:hypothetical protein